VRLLLLLLTAVGLLAALLEVLRHHISTTYSRRRRISISWSCLHCPRASRNTWHPYNSSSSNNMVRVVVRRQRLRLRRA
jgi:hypothetical protein